MTGNEDETLIWHQENPSLKICLNCSTPQVTSQLTGHEIEQLNCIFKLNYLTPFDSSSPVQDEELFLCQACQQLLNHLYQLYNNFLQVSKVESYLTRQLVKLQEIIQSHQDKTINCDLIVTEQESDLFSNQDDDYPNSPFNCESIEAKNNLPSTSTLIVRKPRLLLDRLPSKYLNSKTRSHQNKEEFNDDYLQLLPEIKIEVDDEDDDFNSHNDDSDYSQESFQKSKTKKRKRKSPPKKPRRPTQTKKPKVEDNCPIYDGTEKSFQNVISDEAKCVSFLKSRNLLPISQKCEREVNGNLCQGELKEVVRRRKLQNGTFNETPSLRCTNRKCRTYVSIRKNNKFFTFIDFNGRCNSNLSLCSILELVYFWVNMTKSTDAVQQTGRAERTVREWYNLCRDVCIKMYRRRPKMGGPGCVVQIDESLFKKNTSSKDVDDSNDFPVEESAHNYGSRVNGPWVVCMCCYESNPNGTGQSKILETRFFHVEKRDRATLLPIIQREIRTGSTIHSDEWEAYATLGDHRFIHHIMDHSVNFVDPKTGAHTQTMESVWRDVKVKYGIKTKGDQNLLKEKLIEEWWRSLNHVDPFECFLRDMQIAFAVDEDV